MSITINKVSPTEGETSVSNPVELEAEFHNSNGSEMKARFYGKKEFDTRIVRRIVAVTDGHWNEGRSEHDEPQQHEDAKNMINGLYHGNGPDVVFYVGDLVHDDPDYLSTVKEEFLDELDADSYFAAYGNHDYATETEWQNLFGHGRDHSVDDGRYGYIIPSTSDTSGTYLAADENFVSDKLDEFSDKDWVFVAQHIAPFDDTDRFGVDSPNIRDLYKNNNVALIFLGHHHGKNFIEKRDSGNYAYACSIAGLDFSIDNMDRDSKEDNGFKIVEVFDDNSIRTRQESIEKDYVMESEKLYRKRKEGFHLLREVEGVQDGETVSVKWNSVNPESNFYWYVEAEEV